MAEFIQEAVGIVSSLLLLFGGLVFWPLVRFVAGIAGGSAVWLKRQFYTHILLLAGSFVFLQYVEAVSHPDSLHLRSLPYLIGAVSWVFGLVVLFGTGLWRELGDNAEDGK